MIMCHVDVHVVCIYLYIYIFINLEICRYYTYEIRNTLVVPMKIYEVPGVSV